MLFWVRCMLGAMSILMFLGQPLSHLRCFFLLVYVLQHSLCQGTSCLSMFCKTFLDLRNAHIFLYCRFTYQTLASCNSQSFYALAYHTNIPNARFRCLSSEKSYTTSTFGHSVQRSFVCSITKLIVLLLKVAFHFHYFLALIVLDLLFKNL